MIPITLWRTAACLAAALAITFAGALGAASPALAEEAPDDVYARAMRLIAENRPAEAAALLAHVVEIAPEHAGALLDLAIMQCVQGQSDAAMRLLDTLVARFAPPPSIAALIEALRARGCGSPQAPAAASAAFSIERGHDSNASQGSRLRALTVGGSDGTQIELPLSPEYRSRADRFTLVNAEYAHALPFADARGFAQLQVRRHDALGQYDTAAALLGAEAPWRLGEWQGRAALAVGALSLDKALYQRQARLYWQGEPPLRLPDGWRLHATAELAQLRYPGMRSFDSTTGEVGGLVEWRSERLFWRASLSVAEDRARAERPGGDRRGWQAMMQARFLAFGNSFGDLALSRRVWRGEKAYAPGLIEHHRNQTLDSLTLRLTQPLGASQGLFAELHWIKSRERIAVFGHESGQITVGWEWRSR